MGLGLGLGVGVRVGVGVGVRGWGANFYMERAPHIVTLTLTLT